MSSPEKKHETATGTPRAQKTAVPPLRNECKVYDDRFCSDFHQFNDSNSDDTQFEILSGEPTSNDTSPVKEKIFSQPEGHPLNSDRINELIRQGGDCFHQGLVEENNLQPEKDTCLSNTDATSFVDYFLAHEDLLQALDDYSRSVGQTSVFPQTELSVSSSQYEKLFEPKETDSLSSAQRKGNKNGHDSTVMNAECLTGARNNDAEPGTNSSEDEKRLWKQREEDSLDTKQVCSVAAPRKSEKRKPRTYSQAVPSQHCHICSRRPTETSPHAVCGNLLKGRCRKTICTKCFHQFRWDLKAAREAPPGTWECPHCRGECPQRAQCVIYNRTSDRRRMKLINHRKKKDQRKESAIRKCNVNSNSDGTVLSGRDIPESGTTTTRLAGTGNCSATSQAGAKRRISPKSGKTSLQSHRISKPSKPFGLSRYARLSTVESGVCDEMELNGDRENVWGSAGMVEIGEVLSLDCASKQVEYNQQQLVGKRGEDRDRGKDLEVNGQTDSDDITGMLNYMAFTTEELNSVQEVKTEAKAEMMPKNGNEELHAKVSSLDADQTFETSREDSVNGQRILKLWEDDDVGYAEMDVEGLDLSAPRMDFDRLM